MKSWLSIGAMVGLCWVLAACSSGSTDNASAATVVPQDGGGANPPMVITATSDPANAGLVARVNDVAIERATYERALERRMAVTNAADVGALRQQVLTELIEQALINQGAASLNVAVTDADIDAEIAAQREIAGSDSAWQASLAQNNYSEDEWYAAQRESLLTLRVRNTLIEPLLGEIEQVNARHIVVRTEAEANAILDQLAAGAGFSTLAAEYSIDVTTRDNGGNLGWISRNELFYPNLEAIAFESNRGEIIGPVATSLGYHIIQTLDKAVRTVEPERLPTLSENVFNTWLNAQYRDANIEIYMQ